MSQRQSQKVEEEKPQDEEEAAETFADGAKDIWQAVLSMGDGVEGEEGTIILVGGHRAADALLDEIHKWSVVI